MLKTDQALLEDIMEQCRWIIRYSELADAQSPGERSRIVNSGFNAGDIFDMLHFNAVVMNIQQIGELAKRLSPEFVLRTKNEVSWSDIRGMRNIIAHDYGKLSEKTVREIEIIDIPKLAAFCEKELAATQAQDDAIPVVEAEARKLVGEDGQVFRPNPKGDHCYRGEVLKVTDTHAIQRSSAHAVYLHDLRDFPGDRKPSVGDVLAIRYSNARIEFVEPIPDKTQAKVRQQVLGR